MGIWLLIFIVNLIIPFCMIGFGSHFIKSAPKRINALFGYRTSMSMKNKETWIFAHTCCGKLYRNIGIIMVPLTIIGMLFMIGKERDTVAIAGCVCLFIQAAFLAVPVIITEKALKKEFSKDGNSKGEG